MTEAIQASVVDFWTLSNEIGALERRQMPDLSNPAILAAIERAILDGRAVQYGILAAFVLCIYDYMLTIGDEVELFWTNMDYKIARILYMLVNRQSRLDSE